MKFYLFEKKNVNNEHYLSQIKINLLKAQNQIMLKK